MSTPKSVMHPVKIQLYIYILLQSHCQSCACVRFKSKRRRADRKVVVDATNGSGTLSDEPLFGGDEGTLSDEPLGSYVYGGLGKCLFLCVCVRTCYITSNEKNGLHCPTHHD